MQSINNILLLLVFLSAPVFAESVSIRSDLWFPYNGDPGAEREGYIIDILRAIFKKEGVELDYQILPWNRSLVMSRRGEVDCVVGAYKADAPDFLYPKQTFGKGGNVFFTLKSSIWSYTDFSSFSQQSVGLINAYAYDDEFERFVQLKNDPFAFQYVAGDDPLKVNIDKLVSGRVTVVLENPTVFNAKVEQMGLQGKFRVAGQLTGLSDVYIACGPNSKRSPWIINMVDIGFVRMREANELQVILDRYGLKDWAK